MKTILVPTDFSQPAHNAARYALNLAKGLHANVELCHAMLVPAEAPLAAQVAWPLEDYLSVKKRTDEELKILAKSLTAEDNLPTADEPQHPSISYKSEVGGVREIVRNVVDEHQVNLVVMGMSGAGNLTKFFLGSNSLDMINKTTFPILLVPYNAAFKGIKKIAFATDLSEEDIDIINSIAGLARQFDAEILITHVTNKKMDQLKHQKKIDAFLEEVTAKINYHKIYYRNIKDKEVNMGLTWLSQNAHIDMLVMVHRQRNFLNSLFNSSHTQRLARHIHIPLLVYPEGKQHIKYFL